MSNTMIVSIKRPNAFIISSARDRRSSSFTSEYPKTTASQHVNCLLRFCCVNLYSASAWKCWHVNDTDARSCIDKCEKICRRQSSFKLKMGDVWTIRNRFSSTTLPPISGPSNSLSGSWPAHRRPKQSLNIRFSQFVILFMMVLLVLLLPLSFEFWSEIIFTAK